MNQIGLHLGYWWGTGEEQDIFRMLELTHQAELDIMELNPAWLLRLTEAECVRLLRQARDYGVSMTLNGGLDASNDISSDDPAVRREGVRYCIQVLRRMPLLDLKVWSGVNYSAWLRVPQENFLKERSRSRSLSLESLGEILPVAEELGIDYCFEVCNRYEQFLFNTAREAVAFAEDTGSPRAKVHLDTYHMNIEEDNMFAALAYAGTAERLGHIHIGESNRRLPGVGPTQIDWEMLARALRSVAYGGAVVMEPFVLTSAHNAIRTKTWRDLSRGADLEKLVEDARTGGRFLRTLLGREA